MQKTMDKKEEIESIQKQLREISERYSKWINGKTPSDFGEFMRQSEEINEPKWDLLHRLQELEDVVWTDLPDYGDLMTMEEFKGYCESGMFIDYDGGGNYASATKMSNKDISPSDFKEGRILNNPEFTHVVWFNK